MAYLRERVRLLQAYEKFNDNWRVRDLTNRALSERSALLKEIRNLGWFCPLILGASAYLEYATRYTTALACAREAAGDRSRPVACEQLGRRAPTAQ